MRLWGKEKYKEKKVGSEPGQRESATQRWTMGLAGLLRSSIAAASRWTIRLILRELMSVWRSVTQGTRGGIDEYDSGHWQYSSSSKGQVTVDFQSRRKPPNSRLIYFLRACFFFFLISTYDKRNSFIDQALYCFFFFSKDWNYFRLKNML